MFDAFNFSFYRAFGPRAMMTGRIGPVPPKVPFSWNDTKVWSDTDIWRE